MGQNNDCKRMLIRWCDENPDLCKKWVVEVLEMNMSRDEVEALIDRIRKRVRKRLQMER